MMPQQRDGARYRSALHVGRRAGYIVLGFIFLALGFIGAFLPVMPTTIFLILAAWSFGRSSPGLEAWMLDHPKFGGVLRAWRAHGAIPRRAKWMACIGILLGYVLFWVSAAPSVLLAVVVALAMLACALWIVTRPEGPETEPAAPE
ncbi:YbaN family protein [Kaistia adipata]|uniref:YbaN family protein n=1 Tax=Kaistia adipata TaxID=166954 RepID=UPI000421E0DD|nr:YbaN family protein [Kaistia adipata]